MPVENKERLRIARKLMDDFAQRTGLSGKGGDISERYLWTDALAVQPFFNLARVGTVDVYHGLALKLIEEVHQHLGRYHRGDIRKGWISGLSEQPIDFLFWVGCLPVYCVCQRRNLCLHP